MGNMNKDELAEQEGRIKEKMAQVERVIVVMSGKGGVGKSTIAVNLAYVLALAGNNTVILDVDLHGPNVAKMLGVEDKTMVSSGWGLEAVLVRKNLSAVTLACAGHEPDQPFIWRGPMKSAVIRQLLSDVNWGQLDYLIVDAPPGTGDEHLSIFQSIPRVTGAIIVTTPQDVAVMDARKSIKFAEALKIPVLGIIENMSGFVCPHCGESVDIFKSGGGEQAARELKVNFLGKVPLEAALVDCADKGQPFAAFEYQAPAAQAFMAIVDKIKECVGDKEWHED